MSAPRDVFEKQKGQKGQPHRRIFINNFSPARWGFGWWYWEPLSKALTDSPPGVIKTEAFKPLIFLKLILFFDFLSWTAMNGVICMSITVFSPHMKYKHFSLQRLKWEPNEQKQRISFVICYYFLLNFRVSRSFTCFIHAPPSCMHDSWFPCCQGVQWVREFVL